LIRKKMGLRDLARQRTLTSAEFRFYIASLPQIVS